MVPPSVFVPAPKVESALVQLVRRDAPPVDVPSPDRLFALVRDGLRPAPQDAPPVRCKGAARRRDDRGCSTRPAIDPAGAAPSRSISRRGPRSPASRGRVGSDERAARRAGARHRVRQGDAVAAGPRHAVPTASTSSRRSPCRSASRTTRSRRSRCRTPGVQPRGRRRRRDGARWATTTSRCAPRRQLLLSVGRAGHGVQLVLRKRIPSARGLGGGSADAAAALARGAPAARGRHRRARACTRSRHDLGSDVPFCLTGGAAWMRGRGELLEPAPLPVGHPDAARAAAVPDPDARRCTRRGTSSAARARAGWSGRRVRSPTCSPSSSTTSSPPPRPSSPGCAPFRERARGRRRAPRAPRRQRIRLHRARRRPARPSRPRAAALAEDRGPDRRLRHGEPGRPRRELVVRTPKPRSDIAAAGPVPSSVSWVR